MQRTRWQVRLAQKSAVAPVTRRFDSARLDGDEIAHGTCPTNLSKLSCDLAMRVIRATAQRELGRPQSGKTLSEMWFRIGLTFQNVLHWRGRSGRP